MTHWDKEHLDEGTLQEWLDRDRSGMDAEVASEIERHIADCPRCASLLAEMEALEGRAREILQSGTPISVEPPDYEAVLARSHERAPEAPRRPRWISLAWAASFVAAIGIGWLASDMTGRNEVALEAPAEPAPSTASEERKAPVPAGLRPATPVVAMDSAAPDQGSGADRTTVATADANPDTAGEAGAAAAPTEVAATPEAAATPDVAVANDVAAAPETAAPSVARGAPESTEIPAWQAKLASELVVRGVVTDESTGKPLAGAQVYVEGTGRGALSQEDGTFAIRLPRANGAMTQTAEVPLVAELIGYRTARMALKPSQADTVSADVRLPAESVALGEVVVEAAKEAPSPSASEAQRRAADSAGGAGAPAGFADSLATDGVSWTSVSRTEARERAGFSPLVVPGLDILGIEIGEFRGASAVRVRQALGPETVLTLIQRSDPEGPAGWVWMDGREALSVRRGDLLVTGAGPVPRDSLRGLMERLR